MNTLFLLIVFILAIGATIYKFSKESYPNVGNISPYVPIVHLNETELIDFNSSNISNELLKLLYNGDPSDFPAELFDIPDLNKFSRPFAMTLYLLISLIYVKEFSWEDMTGIKDSTENRRGKSWCVGPFEYLANLNGGFIDKKIREIDYSISCSDEIIRENINRRCAYRDDYYQCYDREYNNATRECRNRIAYPLQTLQMLKQRLLNIKNSNNAPSQIVDDIYNLAKENREYDVILNLSNIKFPPLLMARSSPCVYEQSFNKANEINNSSSISLKSDVVCTSSQINDYATISNVNLPICSDSLLNPTCAMIKWVQNLGATTDPTDIDFGQSIVRQLGSIYKKNNNLTYFISIRGIVFKEESNIVLDAKPKDLGSNFKIHQGFYNIYTNKPVPYDIRKKYLGTNLKCFKNLSNRPNYERKYYEMYVSKGSLQDQIRKFFNDNKDSSGKTKIPQLILSGHSMGAGVVQAILSDILINNLYPKENITCYLLNSPRAVNVELITYITEQLNGRIYSVYNTDDTIVSLPVPHLEIEYISKYIKTKDYEDLTLTYTDEGFTYSNYNNIIGYNYDYYGSIIKNHFFSGFNFGMDSFFNNIYSPNMYITQDIIMNGIYQTVLNENIIPSNFENERGLFMGTTNPAYWNRGYLINGEQVTGPLISSSLKIPTLFPDFYPEKYPINEELTFLQAPRQNNKGYLIFSAIIYLIIDFIKNRIKDQYKQSFNNFLLDIENTIRECGTKINSLFNRKNKIWNILYRFFDKVLWCLEQKLQITNYKDEDIFYLKLSDEKIRSLRNNIKYVHKDNTISLYAVTRTLYLLICPPNLSYITTRNNEYIKRAICSLLNILGYIDYNSISRTDITSLHKYNTNLYVCINSYFSRLGLYYDLLYRDVTSKKDYIRSSDGYRRTYGYDNFDYRIWELLFGQVGKVDKTLIANSKIINTDIKWLPYKPIMNLSKSHGLLFNSNINVNTNTQLLNIQNNYKMPSIFGTFKYLGTSNVKYTSCEINNKCSSYNNDESIFKITPISCTQKIKGGKVYIPFPTFDVKYLLKDSTNTTCYSGNLLTRFGRRNIDCFNTYDPTLSEFFVKYFIDTEDSDEIPILNFANTINIGNVKINCDTCPNKIDYSINNVHLESTYLNQKSYLKNISSDSDGMGGLKSRTISANIYKTTDPNQNKDIYTITINTQWFDKPFLMGRILFDMIIKDLIYALLYSQRDKIKESIERAWEKIKEYYNDYVPIVGSGSLLAISLGAGVGGVSGGILAGTGVIGLVAIIVVLSIITIAEHRNETTNNKLKYILEYVPDFLIKTILEENIPQIDLSSTIGTGYASSLISTYIDRYVDLLLSDTNQLLNPDDVPFWISWKKEVLVALENKPCLDTNIYEYINNLPIDNSNWNINHIPSKLYCNLRTQIFNILANHIKNENFHVFVTGYGTGGAIAHCMMLDSAITSNTFSLDITKNETNSFGAREISGSYYTRYADNKKLSDLRQLLENNYNKFTYYSYGSPRVFNSYVLNWLKEKPKSTLFNLINADDFFTHYPVSSLNSFAINKESEKYKFMLSTYPSTFIFNIPIGLQTSSTKDYQSMYQDLLGLSFKTASTDRAKLFQWVDNGVNNPRHKPVSGYNDFKVYLSHSPKIYMKGVIDLHNKILGGWYVNTDTRQSIDSINKWKPTLDKNVPILPEITRIPPLEGPTLPNYLGKKSK